ncbi:MAG TPA: acetyl-CoA carboxylase carboxyltransferase subunit alpha [Polyangia bacterium]|jgi:acetyl-CoA carboxylase carboxyl transferase subunit alpha|nr:acetyl-CoA carboxylase carboxyltransferase subunit alpha [Polyangia bacterium]
MEIRQALDFEKPILELEQKIAELKQLGGASLEVEVRRLERRARRLQKEVFAELTAWQKVQLSRHPLRPFTIDYIGHLFTDFFELHGDRAFGDDAAIVGGMGWLGARPLVVVGHQKGRGTKENLKRNFGMPRPEGYRKARRLMELGARLGRSIVTFIDTPGAYPGIDAEERGQAEAIAKNLEVMARLPVPIVAVVIGEGGSGGALALGVADRILMLEYAIYSVISPEGCASILWKDQKEVEAAARELKLTAQDLRDLGVADEVVTEPAGGAHRDPQAAARAVEEAVVRHLGELERLAPEVLLERRYEKYRRMGAFVE